MYGREAAGPGFKPAVERRLLDIQNLESLHEELLEVKSQLSRRATWRIQNHTRIVATADLCSLALEALATHL